MASERLAKVLKCYQTMHKAYDVTRQVAHFHSMVYVLADPPHFNSVLLSFADAVNEKNSHFLYGMLAPSCYHANKRKDMLHYLAKSFQAETRMYQGGKNILVVDAQKLTLTKTIPIQARGQVRMRLLNQNLIYGSKDGTLRQISLEKRDALNSNQFKGGIRCLALSPDRKQLAVGLLNGQIQIIDLDAWTPSVQLRGHQSGVRDLV
jgi:hypothetical protein